MTINIMKVLNPKAIVLINGLKHENVKMREELKKLVEFKDRKSVFILKLGKPTILEFENESIEVQKF